MKKTVSGNEAIAYGALRAGVKVVSGYPGTLHRSDFQSVEDGSAGNLRGMEYQRKDSV